MRKVTIDVDEWIKDAEEGKYKVNTSAYAKGCNNVLDYYIQKLEEEANSWNLFREKTQQSLFLKGQIKFVW